MSEFNAYSIPEAIAYLHTLEHPHAVTLVGILEEIMYNANEEVVEDEDDNDDEDAVNEEKKEDDDGDSSSNSSTNPYEELEAQNNHQFANIEVSSDSSDEDEFMAHSIVLQRRGRVPMFLEHQRYFYYQPNGRKKTCTIAQKCTFATVLSSDLNFTGVPANEKQYCKHNSDVCFCSEMTFFNW